jgi:hypothetical protein
MLTIWRNDRIICTNRTANLCANTQKCVYFKENKKNHPHREMPAPDDGLFEPEFIPVQANSVPTMFAK